MEAGDVIQLLKLLEQHEIAGVVDGGWGVDALLGHCTRPHEDLDIAIEHQKVRKLRNVLGRIGYAELPQPDRSDFNFVLGGQRSGTKSRRTFLHARCRWKKTFTVFRIRPNL
jgi:Aminoglycoside-2''-adenylyltransferase